MFKKMTRILSGDPDRRDMERYAAAAEIINQLEPEMQALSDEALRAKTDVFRARLKEGETLDDILSEAFAVVRETAIRTLGMRHFDIQLIGGMVLHEGRIAEMRTGEGKTLAATMPIYLNALPGAGVHLVTVNDYLARRDARWMGPVFDFLGMSVGILQSAARTEGGKKAFIYAPGKESPQEDVHQLSIVDRKDAYAADITYGTNNEFGFDYLRDNMAQTLERRSQRGHNYAILDETDNILIDEARTPLIISGPSHEDPETYLKMAQIVKQLRPEDFEISERDRNIALTEVGENHVEQLLGMTLRDPDRPEDITPEQARMLGYLEQALRAQYIFKRNKDYVVQAGKVIIVDEFTGRMMAGRRWSDGLHQAVEAKEGVNVGRENVTYATITLQNYFRMYAKLAGMTGTAVTEAEEFNEIYNVDVLALPMNLEYIASRLDSELNVVEYKEDGNKFYHYARSDDPEQAPVFWKRKDYPDAVYRTEEAKLRAIALEILQRHAIGQPMLVGTTSVELSEKLSRRLKAEMLQKLCNVMILRHAYMEANNIDDNGMRVKELVPLYEPLDKLNASVLRPFARELELSLNPSKPENIARLGKILHLRPEEEQRLAKILQSGIRHNVLNAKKHTEESQIIAGAGELGAVTIATNMAGRGVDIKLGGDVAEEVLGAVNRVLRRCDIGDPSRLSMEERLAQIELANDEQIGIYRAELKYFREHIENEKRVKQVGGLHVLGSERHDSRRIDNQLRGRSGRQGDPGSSQFFLSLEDELMRLFGGSQVGNMMARLNIDDVMPIAHKMVDRTIEQAQTRVEGANFDTRKHLLEYDDVLNQQREVFYGQRNRVFTKDDLSQDVAVMLKTEVERHIALLEDDDDGPWKLLAWLEEVQPTLALKSETPYPSYMLRVLLNQMQDVDQPEAVKAKLTSFSEDAMQTQYDHLVLSAAQQMDRALERLDDQVDQRIELADTAIEGALIDAEENDREVDVDAMLAAVERTVGLRIQMTEEDRQQLRADPDRLRKRLPQFVEGSLGIRIWAGMLQAIEQRIGESLNLETKVQLPINWVAARQSLMSALAAAWERRTEKILADVQRDLESIPAGSAVSEAEKIRLLVQLSYGKHTIFDKRTHQRKAVTVARFSYAFSAGRLLAMDLDELTDEIMVHLVNAQTHIEKVIGESEIARLGNNRFGDIEDQLRNAMIEKLGPTDAEQYQQTALYELPEDVKKELARVMGSTIMGQFYRRLFLSAADRQWVEYLTQMEALRTSIGLEAYGQRDPLVQYKSRAFDMFKQLLDDIRAGMVSRMFRLQLSAATSGQSSQATGNTAPVAAKSAGGSKSKRRRKRR